MYHVMNRGDQREDSFRDDEDRQRFLSTLGEAYGQTVAGTCVLPDAQSFSSSGNHHEFEVDRPAPTDGQLDLRFQPAE